MRSNLRTKAASRLQLADSTIVGAGRAGVVYDTSSGKLTGINASGGEFGLVAQGKPKPDWSAATNTFVGIHQAILTDGALPIPSPPPAPKP